MVSVLKSLEPIHEQKNTIIINELDEQNELLFYHNGQYAVGYEINRVKKFVLRFQNSNVIGAFACTFNKRSVFIYKTISLCHGYFIRKLEWQNILSENESIGEIIKEEIADDFKFNIKAKVLKEKQRDLARWHSRADYDEILSITKKNAHIPNAAIDSEDEELVRNTTKFLDFITKKDKSKDKEPVLSESKKIENQKDGFLDKLDDY